MNLTLFDDELGYLPVLLSLKRAWLLRMVSGEKKHEFRRVFVSVPTCAFVYLVKPDAIVSHVLWLGSAVKGSPGEIAEIGERERVGGAESLLRYFGNRSVAFALPILGVGEIEPISLEELRKTVPGFMPPQSYFRLENHPVLLQILLSRSKSTVDTNGFHPKT